MDWFRLRGSRRGFSLNSSVSSSITHLGAILYLHLSSLLLSFHFIVDNGWIWLRIMITVVCASLLLFCTWYKLSKSHLAVILIWGSKQARVFTEIWAFSWFKQTYCIMDRLVWLRNLLGLLILLPWTLLRSLVVSYLMTQIWGCHFGHLQRLLKMVL